MKSMLKRRSAYLNVYPGYYFALPIGYSIMRVRLDKSTNPGIFWYSKLITKYITDIYIREGWIRSFYSKLIQQCQ